MMTHARKWLATTALAAAIMLPRAATTETCLSPYIKGLYGRGVFNFPFNEANLAYNSINVGAGVDIKVHPRINVRAEYEYQNWFSFPFRQDG